MVKYRLTNADKKWLVGYKPPRDPGNYKETTPPVNAWNAGPPGRKSRVTPPESTTGSGSRATERVPNPNTMQAPQAGSVPQHIRATGNLAPSGVSVLAMPTSSSLTAKDAWNSSTVNHSDLYRRALTATSSVSCMIAEGGIGFAFPAKCMETWLGQGPLRHSNLATARQQRAQTTLMIPCLGEVCLDGQPTNSANRSWRRVFLEHGSVYTLRISSSRAAVAITLPNGIAGVYLDSLAAGYPEASGNTPQKGPAKQAGHWEKHESSERTGAIYTHVIQLDGWCALLG